MFIIKQKIKSCLTLVIKYYYSLLYKIKVIYLNKKSLKKKNTLVKFILAYGRPKP